MPLKTLKAKEAPKTKEEKQAARVAKETKKLLDIEIAKARNVRDGLKEKISLIAQDVVVAVKSRDAKEIKKTKARLARLAKAIDNIT